MACLILNPKQIWGAKGSGQRRASAQIPISEPQTPILAQSSGPLARVW